ncbi:hypothetical protein [Nitrosomonas marina]|uniref:Uncharacterized protein n=1 Tax=Nitrosomonas marina TaxID=917 RepID=A0A1H8FF71_9PROT|nr:hypothetical protein [Nitrosomonas marina]SEN30276.1 hypothetical protein SAMN05216325_1138 [Nitrosomonas marina]
MTATKKNQFCDKIKSYIYRRRIEDKKKVLDSNVPIINKNIESDIHKFQDGIPAYERKRYFNDIENRRISQEDRRKNDDSISIYDRNKSFNDIEDRRRNREDRRKKDVSIPVFDRKKRLSNIEDRRINEKDRRKKDSSIYGDRRKEPGDRRKIKGLFLEDLINLVNVLRDEQTTLINFIADKEQKRISILRFQLAAIAILGISTIASLPLLNEILSPDRINIMTKSQESDQQLNPQTKAILYTDTINLLKTSAPTVEQTETKPISTVESVNSESSTEQKKLFDMTGVILMFCMFNIAGSLAVIAVSLINVAVVRYVLSIKSNITLAVRQLNCNREAIQRAITAQLCGAYPTGLEYKNKNEWSIGNTLYLTHNKFPVDNTSLRHSFFRRYRNKLLIRCYKIFNYFFSAKLKECNDENCEEKNKKFVEKCITLTFSDNEVVHYPVDKYGAIYTSPDKRIPDSFLERILSLGYRSCYVQSADMWAVVASCITTTLVSLLLPLGNFYLWFVTKGIEYDSLNFIFFEISVPSFIALSFASLGLIITYFFAKHFSKIIYSYLNKLIDIVTNDSDYSPKKVKTLL